jgi:hypothetical protein
MLEPQPASSPRQHFVHPLLCTANPRSPCNGRRPPTAPSSPAIHLDRRACPASYVWCRRICKERRPIDSHAGPHNLTQACRLLPCAPRMPVAGRRTSPRRLCFLARMPQRVCFRSHPQTMAGAPPVPIGESCCCHARSASMYHLPHDVRCPLEDAHHTWQQVLLPLLNSPSSPTGPRGLLFVSRRQAWSAPLCTLHTNCMARRAHLPYHTRESLVSLLLELIHQCGPAPGVFPRLRQSCVTWNHQL